MKGSIMCPILSVQASPNAKVGTFDHEGGSIAPAFEVKYLRLGIWHHFEYQAHDSAHCLQTYVESIGLDYKSDIEYWPILSRNEVIDLQLGKDIDPRFSKTRRITVVVSYSRRNIVHRFGFDTSSGDYWALERYVEMLGMKMSDVKIKVLPEPILV